MNYKFDQDKAREAIVFIVSRVKSSDLHTVFKALYFAEKKHIAEYGRSITGDRFIAMDYGPVPSTIYDFCKASRSSKEPFEEAFRQEGKYLCNEREADLDYLAGSDIKCLEQGIAKVAGLGFEARKRLSHDSAWEQAPANGTINPLRMAEDEGAEEGTLEYIHDTLKLVNL